MPNRIPNAQESDTTGNDSSNAVHFIKNFILNLDILNLISIFYSPSSASIVNFQS
jgi:hypothetical protein